MLAGLVFFSVAFGLIAVGGSVALSMPVWVTLAVYPATCSLTLLLTATLRTYLVNDVKPEGQFVALVHRTGAGLQ
jgi:hypothetical protein